MATMRGVVDLVSFEPRASEQPAMTVGESSSLEDGPANDPSVSKNSHQDKPHAVRGDSPSPSALDSASQHSRQPRAIEFVDSHTAGEPTRVVIEGGPDLGTGSLAERRELFQARFDHFRSAIVNEPRGSDVLVGALLCEPTDVASTAGVIFFNNVGVLNGCGHGTIGLVVTLFHLGRIGHGTHRIETPVGTVSATLIGENQVAIENVPSYRQAKDVRLTIDGLGEVVGDVAWGGNWFFLTKSISIPLEMSSIDALTDAAWRIRKAVNAQGFPDVDHVELFGAPSDPKADSKSFVLCPGKAYDRSPCGTGTSAKLACLAADGDLEEGDAWVQESIVGTSFVGRFRWQDAEKQIIVPTVTGRAWVTAEGRLLLDESDPFAWGIRTA